MAYTKDDIKQCKQENLFRKWDKERAEALHSGNARMYALRCDQLGIEPEDKELYDVGCRMMNQ